MQLFYREKGTGTPLIILHGLWGASDNWLPVAGLLADRFRVILPDLRNHGLSPHSDEMNYQAMSDDVIELIQSLDLPEPPHIAGHSMGGKTVMALLMKHPDRVAKAAVMDIAPIAYTGTDGGRHGFIIDFMTHFDPAAYPSRQALTEAIRSRFKSERTRQLFLKNIGKTGRGFAWRPNIAALEANFSLISGCPEGLPRSRYDREILFVKAEHSDLIPGRECLLESFPAARLTELPACTHWLHTEQPEALAALLRNYFSLSV